MDPSTDAVLPQFRASDCVTDGANRSGASRARGWLPSAFHFDPLIAYPGAERDYVRSIDELLETIREKISFISMGGLRMTPTLRTIARRRFPQIDAMPVRTCSRATALSHLHSAPAKLYRTLAERFRKAGADVHAYCAWNRRASTSESSARLHPTG